MSAPATKLKPARPIDRTTRVADRITTRDAEILRLLAEHQMLTVGQLATALFSDVRKARARVAVLRALGLVDTFRPPLARGTSPSHCVATSRARTLIAASGRLDVQPPRRRVGLDAAAIALRPDLAHLRGANEVFCQLLGRARHSPDDSLDTWRSERTCARILAASVKPDGFGRWRSSDAWCEFFLEYDTGTEPHSRLTAKLDGYADLAESAGVSCSVLFWLPNPTRETNLHQHLRDEPPRVPVATAHGDPATCDPAGPIWRPAWSATPERFTLAALGAAAAFHLDVPQRPHILL